MNYQAFLIFCRDCEYIAYYEAIEKCGRCGSCQLICAPIIYHLRSPTRHRPSRKRISEENASQITCRQKLFALEKVKEE